MAELEAWEVAYKRLYTKIKNLRESHDYLECEMDNIRERVYLLERGYDLFSREVSDALARIAKLEGRDKP